MNTFVILVVAIFGMAAGQTEGPVQPTPDPSFKCPTEEGLYPHPSDCAKFYECSGFLAWLLHCDADLLFNPAIGQCDWPANVKCSNARVPQEGLPKESRGQEIIGPGNYTCTENGAFPHEELCEYYYDCWEGEAMLGRCTDTYLFDLTYMGCNYPNSVNCGDRIRPNGTTNPTTKKPIPTTTRLPGSGPTDGPGEGEFECPEFEGLFPNPADCNTFYQCVEFIPFLNECPFPLVFNPDFLVCDFISNVPSCQ